jgi:hypothetical protein
MTWHKLTKGEQSTLVAIGLESRKRLHRDNERGVSLLRKGLIEGEFQNFTSVIYKLTEEGRQVLLAAPTKTGTDLFPLPADIQKVQFLLRSAAWKR